MKQEEASTEIRSRVSAHRLSLPVLPCPCIRSTSCRSKPYPPLYDGAETGTIIAVGTIAFLALYICRLLAKFVVIDILNLCVCTSVEAKGERDSVSHGTP